LIDINRVDALKGIHHSDGMVRVGALTRHVEVMNSPVVAQHLPLIAEAMPHVAHVAVRNRGTFGGSIALADPAAELPACLVALDAVVRVLGRNGPREISAASFFLGIYTTDLRSGEIVTAVVVPPIQPGWRSRFNELARRHGDYALVGLAAHCRVEGSAIAETRLAFCGVGTTPVRASRAEAALAGRRPGAEVMAEAGRALDADLDPPGDVHASAPLRRHLARVLLARAVVHVVG
jgi:aerobic carbon-monoxide dehydrogenase medium subunit